MARRFALILTLMAAVGALRQRLSASLSALISVPFFASYGL
jgi:hypothetical protein